MISTGNLPLFYFTMFQGSFLFGDSYHYSFFNGAIFSICFLFAICINVIFYTCTII